MQHKEGKLMKTYVLPDGTFKLDGGTLFARLSRMHWDGVRVDRKSRVTLSLNCLLLIMKVEGKERRILVNTGLGQVLRSQDDFHEEYLPTPRRLDKGFKNLGIKPSEIDVVILTDFRFPYTGGCTRLNRKGESIPTFPNAMYVAHQAALEEALRETRNEIYREVEKSVINPLVKANKLTLVQENIEIVPGVRLFKTDGPCKGHQMVVVEQGSERILFPGTLIPTLFHFRKPECIWGIDQEPQVTLEWRKTVIRVAEKEGFLLVFPHSLVRHRGGIEESAGYVEKDREGRYGLRPVSLKAT